jgi:hypothetical protein
LAGAPEFLGDALGEPPRTSPCPASLSLVVARGPGGARLTPASLRSVFAAETCYVQQTAIAMRVEQFRALWPMEWHRKLVAGSCFGVLAVTAALLCMSKGAWVAAAVFATLAFILIGRVLDFRFYWTWVIQVDDSGVHQLGGLGRRRDEVEVHVPWQAVTVWERTRLTKRGRPKIRGESVYTYEVAGETSSRIVWQSNYFPRNKRLVQLVIEKLGNPKEL